MSEFRWTSGPLGQVKAELRAGVIDGMDRGAVLTQKSVKAQLSSAGASNIGSGGKASPPGGSPAVDSGSLRNSIQIDRTGLTSAASKTRLSVKVGTALPYAAIQEFGGVVRAKKVKRLPIPFPGQEKRAKQLRRKAGKSLHNLPKGTLTYVKRKNGAPLLVEINSDGSWTPIFILKKRVRLPARPYIRPGFRRANMPILQAISKSIAMAIRKLGGKARINVT